MTRSLYFYEINYSYTEEYAESPDEITKEQENEIWDRLYKEVVELYPVLDGCTYDQYRICEDGHSDSFLLTFSFALEVNDGDDPEEVFAEEYPELADALDYYYT